MTAPQDSRVAAAMPQVTPTSLCRLQQELMTLMVSDGIF